MTHLNLQPERFCAFHHWHYIFKIRNIRFSRLNNICRTSIKRPSKPHKLFRKFAIKDFHHYLNQVIPGRAKPEMCCNQEFVDKRHPFLKARQVLTKRRLATKQDHACAGGDVYERIYRTKLISLIYDFFDFKNLSF